MNKEYDKTINILKDVISKEPDNACSIRIIAYSYLRLDELKKVNHIFKNYLNCLLLDYLPTDYENYADLLSKTGNDSLAIEYLLKIPEMDSTRKDIYGKISVTLF